MSIVPIMESWKITCVLAIVTLVGVYFAGSYYYNNIYYTTITKYGPYKVVYTTSAAGADGSQQSFLYKGVSRVRYRDGVLKLLDDDRTDDAPDFVVNNVMSYSINPKIEYIYDGFPEHQVINMSQIKAEQDRQQDRQNERNRIGRANALREAEASGGQVGDLLRALINGSQY